MSFTVQHKRSIVENHRPLAESLVEGQLGINLHNNSPALFFKTGTDAIVKVGPTFLGQTAPTLESNASYGIGEMWMDTTANVNTLNVWDGATWRGVTGDANLSDIYEDVVPNADCVYSIGTSTNQWLAVYACDVFTGDLHLSNEKSGGNDVDGTWGNYTIQEGEEDLFLINNRSGKKYRFLLEPVTEG